jgi:hypothetical protein
MMPWFSRYVVRMAGILCVMLFIEYITFVFYRSSGINRFVWLPVSLALVALAGFDTVSRLPLVWGAFSGGLLYGLTSIGSWVIGSWVLQGRWRFPDEAEPLLVALTFALTAVIGAVVGGTTGVIARGRRRARRRRSTIKTLAYSSFDAPDAVVDVPTPQRPMMPVSERR